MILGFRRRDAARMRWWGGMILSGGGLLCILSIIFMSFDNLGRKCKVA